LPLLGVIAQLDPAGACSLAWKSGPPVQECAGMARFDGRGGHTFLLVETRLTTGLRARRFPACFQTRGNRGGGRLRVDCISYVRIRGVRVELETHPQRARPGTGARESTAADGLWEISRGGQVCACDHPMSGRVWSNRSLRSARRHSQGARNGRKNGGVLKGLASTTHRTSFDATRTGSVVPPLAVDRREASLPFRPEGRSLLSAASSSGGFHCRARAIPTSTGNEPRAFRDREDNDARKQGDAALSGAAPPLRSFAPAGHRHEVGRDDKSRRDEHDVLGIPTRQPLQQRAIRRAINETVRTDRKPGLRWLRRVDRSKG